MLFSDPNLQAELQALMASDAARTVAIGHNLHFETRIARDRQDRYEAGRRPSESLLDHQTRHYRHRIVRRAGIPETFEDTNRPASISSMEPNQTIVRLEILGTALEDFGGSGDVDQLRAAVNAQPRSVDQQSLVESFLVGWNPKRDYRPCFGAFLAEVEDEVSDANWAARLRDRLGLAHYAPRDDGKALEVGLFVYSAESVFEETARKSVPLAFTVPTALDGGPWPYFFPSPSGLSCGRTMNLHEVQSDSELLQEILHYKFPYEASHFRALTYLATPVEPFSLKKLRNSHLWALRVAANDDQFGEEMGGHVCG